MQSATYACDCEFNGDYFWFMRFLIFVFGLIVYVPLQASAQMDQVLAAIFKLQPNLDWQKSSVVVGDFSCRGKNELAILGTNESEIVLAIFLDGLVKAPSLLRYSAKARDPQLVVLMIENGDFDEAELKLMLENVPDGLRSSKSCKWLNLSDGKIDAVHIYWNHKAKRFNDWSL